ncbi:hypothetical protein G9A89_018011 [Geosiphon pyriformis]|nr:hypothetical protein G9A89_018011 [Geosiphon pyriformis]
MAGRILLFVCLEGWEICSISPPSTDLEIWTGCKGKFDSEGLFVSLVVVDNNSGVVVEYMRLVVCIGAVDSEVWNIGIPCFADI